MKKTSRNDITGDWMQSKPNSEQFEKNWDLIFGKKDTPAILINESMEEHKGVYEYLDNIEKGMPVKEALAEYELNKSTGEIQKKDDECPCGVKGCE